MKQATHKVAALLFIVTSTFGSLYAELPGKESHALRTLFNNTGGSNWRNKQDWKGAPGTEHTWYGITCNEAKTAVLEIRLADNNLQGELPAEIGDLAKLTVLDLSNNRLTGTIPMWIEKLGNLKKLDLSRNNFVGAMPGWLGQLHNLEELVLDDNHLEGAVPAALAGLGKLRVLSIGSNRLTGNIPAALSKLTRLENGRSNFKWNGLYTADANLRRFLKQKQAGADWESTQTVPPAADEIKVVEVTEETVTLNWQPIAYIADSGGYRVSFRQQGEPFQEKNIVETPDKTETEAKLKDLEKRSIYYIKIETWTDSHKNNRNRIVSVSSREFGAGTRGIVISGTINVYSDTEHTRLQPFGGIQVSASGMGGAVTTDKEGKYSLNVGPGWSGTVTPMMKGYDFSPAEREYESVQDDQLNQDFTAAAYTIISGKVTYKGRGIAGVDLAFTGRDGTAALAHTAKDGTYQHIVSYNWSGTVSPKKAGHRFAPQKKEYFEVTKPLAGEDFEVDLPMIFGRVTGSGRRGVPGVKLLFSNVEGGVDYLSDHAVSDAKGNYRLAAAADWSGSVTPQSPKRKGYLFYPRIRYNITAENAGQAVNFRAERDFNFFIAAGGSYALPTDSIFKEVYGSGAVLNPEFYAGWKFSRNLYIWGAYGLFSKSGRSTSLGVESRWKQQQLSLGLGYYKSLSISMALQVRAGAVSVSYSEEVEEYEESDSFSAFGFRLDGGWVYKIGGRLFFDLSLGYLLASDTIEDIDLKIKLGGFRAGLGLGWRF